MPVAIIIIGPAYNIADFEGEQLRYLEELGGVVLLASGNVVHQQEGLSHKHKTFTHSQGKKSAYTAPFQHNPKKGTSDTGTKHGTNTIVSVHASQSIHVLYNCTMPESDEARSAISDDVVSMSPQASARAFIALLNPGQWLRRVPRTLAVLSPLWR